MPTTCQIRLNSSDVAGRGEDPVRDRVAADLFEQFVDALVEHVDQRPERALPGNVDDQRDRSSAPTADASSTARSSSAS